MAVGGKDTHPEACGSKDTKFPGVCTPVLIAHSVRVFILALPPYTPLTFTPTALLLALIF